MKNLKRNMLYGITLAVLVFVVFWENFMQTWIDLQADRGESVLRVDLFVIYPLVITLVALSVYHMFRKK